MILAALLPVFSTLLGGLAVLRWRHRLHPIMALAAGILLATALTELMAESMKIVAAEQTTFMMLLGFLFYTALENVVERQAHEHRHAAEDDCDEEASLIAPLTTSSWLTLVGPLSLVGHSFMDGLVIGLSFSFSNALGLIVTVAVVGHDFADGLNVVALALTSGADKTKVRLALLADALIVPCGALIGYQVHVNETILGLALGFFAGVFIAIGAGHLLPEAQHAEGTSFKLIFYAALGIVFVLLLRMAAVG
jgi:ZIP family zinc transporter